ncbi:hypothetical protein BT96DRAFT_947230 [Gymnopus androsaceus JB14]|uniref:Uncharacterized protein n=1 Tax=Gymnopus androsaceus JB14 TaxID=1447944 RepID=A0A6A4GTE5_9AGAR|nr:hypothetical protein BT96DRAFT_947230 [Gymnopus androsaceus JB14]
MAKDIGIWWLGKGDRGASTTLPNINCMRVKAWKKLRKYCQAVKLRPTYQAAGTSNQSYSPLHSTLQDWWSAQCTSIHKSQPPNVLAPMIYCLSALNYPPQLTQPVCFQIGTLLHFQYKLLELVVFLVNDSSIEAGSCLACDKKPNLMQQCAHLKADWLVAALAPANIEEEDNNMIGAH